MLRNREAVYRYVGGEEEEEVGLVPVAQHRRGQVVLTALATVMSRCAVLLVCAAIVAGAPPPITHHPILTTHPLTPHYW